MSTSPSFTTSVTFTLWPWTLRADPTAFTSSCNHTSAISTTDATATVLLLPTVCSGNLSHDTHELVTLKTYHYIQPSIDSRMSFICFPVPFILILSAIVWRSKDPLPCVGDDVFMLQLLSLHRISSRSKCTFFLVLYSARPKVLAHEKSDEQLCIRSPLARPHRKKRLNGPIRPLSITSFERTVRLGAQLSCERGGRNSFFVLNNVYTEV